MPRIKSKKGTIKQRKLVAELVNNSSQTTREAMVKAGYSINSNPTVITSQKNFQELLDKYLPDSLLLRTTKQGAKATKPFINNKGQEREIPDWQARLKATEMGFKLKGKYIENATQVNVEGIKIEVTEAPKVTED